jgi:glycosyltransferase involved in cell wall biosynthesis
MPVVEARSKVDVACFTGQSGLTDYSVSLCRGLARHADVRLLTAADLPQRFESDRHEVQRVFRRSRHYPLDLPKYVRAVLSRRPDWIVQQAPLKFPLLEGAAVVPLLRRFGVKCALTVHDVLPHYPRPWSRAEFGWYYRRFDRLLVHSRAAEQQVRDLGFDGPVLVVPHGRYDLFKIANPTREAARIELGLQLDAFVVLFFGHLEPRKGFPDFVRAAAALAGDTGVHCLVAGANATHGANPEQAAAIAQARTLPNVTLHDRRIPFEEVERYFAAANVIALPYREGTTSGVLRLALAFDRPVVATRVGDLAEEVPPGAGVMLDAGPDLAERLVPAILRARDEEASLRGALLQATCDDDWTSVSLRYAQFLGLANN